MVAPQTKKKRLEEETLQVETVEVEQRGGLCTTDNDISHPTLYTPRFRHRSRDL